MSFLLCDTLFFQTGSFTDLADRLLVSMLQGPFCLHPSTLGPQLTEWLDQLPSKLQGLPISIPQGLALPRPATTHCWESEQKPSPCKAST